MLNVTSSERLVANRFAACGSAPLRTLSCTPPLRVATLVQNSDKR